MTQKAHLQFAKIYLIYLTDKNLLIFACLLYQLGQTGGLSNLVKVFSTKKSKITALRLYVDLCVLPLHVGWDFCSGLHWASYSVTFAWPHYQKKGLWKLFILIRYMWDHFIWFWFLTQVQIMIMVLHAEIYSFWGRLEQKLSFSHLWKTGFQRMSQDYIWEAGTQNCMRMSFQIVWTWRKFWGHFQTMEGWFMLNVEDFYISHNLSSPLINPLLQWVRNFESNLECNKEERNKRHTLYFWLSK